MGFSKEFEALEGVLCHLGYGHDIHIPVMEPGEHLTAMLDDMALGANRVLPDESPLWM